MSSKNGELSIRSIAELSLVVSRAFTGMMADGRPPSATLLRQFWQSARSLERCWMDRLQANLNGENLDTAELLSMSSTVFLTEMLVRTFSTVLTGMGQPADRLDGLRLAGNVVCAMSRVRNQILNQVLNLPSSEHNHAAEIDQLRRRVERWTDLLVGPVATATGCFDFTFVPDRARDFGNEDLSESSPAGQIASAGLRFALIQNVSNETVVEPDLSRLMQSILASIPKGSIHRDGSLRSSIEQRIIASRTRMERRADFLFPSSGNNGTISPDKNGNSTGQKRST